MTPDEKYRKTQTKNRAYATQRTLRLIRKGQPKTFEEAQSLGIVLVEAGLGAFRSAYRIYGTRLLIKFPLRYRCKNLEMWGGPEVWHDKDGKNHARMEVKKIRELMQCPIMRKHIPPVYYFNSKDGVTVTRYWPKSKGLKQAVTNMLSEMIKEYCGVKLGDLTYDNLRQTSDSQLVIIDLGY